MAHYVNPRNSILPKGPGYQIGDTITLADGSEWRFTANGWEPTIPSNIPTYVAAVGAPDDEDGRPDGTIYFQLPDPEEEEVGG